MFKSYGKEISEKSKKIDRIDELMQQLNKCWVAPLNLDIYTNRYFYELIISLLETLSLEISPELNKDELEVDDKARKEIAESLLKKPIFVFRFDDSLGGKKRKLVSSPENWKELKALLYSYDKLVRSWINNKLKTQLYGDNVDITEIDEEGNIVGMSEEEED